MLKNDYIMRMIMDLVMTIRKVWDMPDLDKDDAMDDIEESVSRAVNIERGLLFSLEPESMISMLEIGDFDAGLAAYVSKALFIEVRMLEAEGRIATADLRRSQAMAIAKRYGCVIPSSEESAQGLMREFVEEFSESDSDDDSLDAKISSENKSELVSEENSNSDGTNISTNNENLCSNASSISGIPLEKLKF